MIFFRSQFSNLIERCSLTIQQCICLHLLRKKYFDCMKLQNCEVSIDKMNLLFLFLCLIALGMVVGLSWLHGIRTVSKNILSIIKSLFWKSIFFHTIINLIFVFFFLLFSNFFLCVPGWQHITSHWTTRPIYSKIEIICFHLLASWNWHLFPVF